MRRFFVLLLFFFLKVSEHRNFWFRFQQHVICLLKQTTLFVSFIITIFPTYYINKTSRNESYQNIRLYLHAYIIFIFLLFTNIMTPVDTSGEGTDAMYVQVVLAYYKGTKRFE